MIISNKCVVSEHFSLYLYCKHSNLYKLIIMTDCYTFKCYKLVKEDLTLSYLLIGISLKLGNGRKCGIGNNTLLTASVR